MGLRQGDEVVLAVGEEAALDGRPEVAEVLRDRRVVVERRVLVQADLSHAAVGADDPVRRDDVDAARVAVDVEDDADDS